MLQQGIRVFGRDTKLLGWKSDDCADDSGKLVDAGFHFGSTVGTVQVLQEIGACLGCSGRFYTGYHLYLGLNGGTDVLNEWKQGVRVLGGQAELFGGKGDGGILHFWQLFDFFLHFGSTVGTIQVF